MEEFYYNTESILTENLLLEVEQGEGKNYKQITHAKVSLAINGVAYTMGAAQTLRELDNWIISNYKFTISENCKIETSNGFISLKDASEIQKKLESKSGTNNLTGLAQHIGLLIDKLN
jgi:hypothetical protein